eukprot:1139827-Pelagomonas_calceolata.AAC.4
MKKASLYVNILCFSSPMAPVHLCTHGMGWHGLATGKAPVHLCTHGMAGAPSFAHGACASVHTWHGLATGKAPVVGPLGLRTYMLPLCKAVLKQALLFSFYVNMHKRSPTCAHTHRHTHTPFQDPLASLAAKRGMGRAALGC